MKALLSHAPGGPDTLTVDELPDPVAGPGQLLVRVRAAAINAGNAATQPSLIAQVQRSFQEPAAQEIAEQFLAAVRKDVGVKRDEKAIAAARARLTSSGY